MAQRKLRVGRARTGLGLFAIKPYRKREYIATYRGRMLRNPEAEAMEARGARYMFEVNTKWTIDGSSRANIARYANHSCRPNAEAIERRGPIIVYVARKRIKPEEEITVDYGKDYFAAFIGKTRCQCPKCRERRADQQARSRAKAKRAKVKALKLRRERRAAAALVKASATKTRTPPRAAKSRPPGVKRRRPQSGSSKASARKRSRG